MKYIYIIFCLLIILQSCGSDPAPAAPPAKIEFNAELAEELAKMVVTDQIAAFGQDSIFIDMSHEKKKAFKDSVYQTHQKRLEEIYNKHGYPGIDLLGKEGEKNFWLMTQHCDFNPDFQNRVLEGLEKEVAKGNADSRNFGLLRDRVNINTGKKQIYGTQVTYVQKTGQAIPKPLADSASVNERRAAVELESIEEYLNVMTIMHFDMNKKNLIKRGVKAPILYASEAWENSEAAAFFRQEKMIE